MLGIGIMTKRPICKDTVWDNHYRQFDVLCFTLSMHAIIATVELIGSLCAALNTTVLFGLQQETNESESCPLTVRMFVLGVQ